MGGSNEVSLASITKKPEVADTSFGHFSLGLRGELGENGYKAIGPEIKIAASLIPVFSPTGMIKIEPYARFSLLRGQENGSYDNNMENPFSPLPSKFNNIEAGGGIQINLTLFSPLLQTQYNVKVGTEAGYSSHETAYVQPLSVEAGINIPRTPIILEAGIAYLLQLKRLEARPISVNNGVSITAKAMVTF